MLADTPPPRDIGKPRLPVDRVFTLPGIGTVVTGTLFGGTLRRGQSVVIQPSGKTTRIRRIQSHGHDVEASGPGTRTALNLADVDAVEDVHRGDVVTLAELGGPSEVLDVLLEISPRGARSVKDGLRVRAHHGSGNVAAHVALASGKELAAGARALAQLRLEAPAFVFAGDHFTVRDWSEQHTLAGAIVLDPDASRKAFRSAGIPVAGAALRSRLRMWTGFVASYVARDGAVRRSQLLLKSHFSSADIDRRRRTGSSGTARSWRRAISSSTPPSGRRPAGKQPKPSMPRIEHIPSSSVFRSRTCAARSRRICRSTRCSMPLVASLCEGEFVRVGSVVRRAAHRPALPEPLQAAGAKLVQALAAKPSIRRPARSWRLMPLSQRALRFLIETGEVVEINAELVMAAQGVDAGGFGDHAVHSRARSRDRERFASGARQQPAGRRAAARTSRSHVRDVAAGRQAGAAPLRRQCE